MQSQLGGDLPDAPILQGQPEPVHIQQTQLPQRLLQPQAQRRILSRHRDFQRLHSIRWRLLCLLHLDSIEYQAMFLPR